MNKTHPSVEGAEHRYEDYIEQRVENHDRLQAAVKARWEKENPGKQYPEHWERDLDYTTWMRDLAIDLARMSYFHYRQGEWAEARTAAQVSEAMRQGWKLAVQREKE